MCMYFMYVTFNHVPLVQITNCALHVHVSCVDVHGHTCTYMYIFTCIGTALACIHALYTALK